MVICTDQCTLGTQQCSGNGVQTCVTGALGCTSFGSSVACGLGQVCDGVAAACVAEPLEPRIVAPLGGSLVSGGVVFRWETAASSSESVLQVCSDISCANVVAQVSGTTGATLSPPLPRGTYFVRARGRRQRADLTYLEGTQTTRTRAIFVTGRPVASPALLGMMPDFDGDGRPEEVIGDTAPLTSVGGTLQVRWGKGGASTTLSGGWYSVGQRDSSFASKAQNLGDFVGDGRPQLVTVQSTVQMGGAPVDPFSVVRYGLNLQGALVQLQAYDVPGPFHSLLPAGDIDGDGYADLLAVRRLPQVFISGNTWAETGVEVVILFGGPSGFQRTGSLQFDIPVALRDYYTSVTVRGVGDVDGDGFADVALGVSANPSYCNTTGSSPPPIPSYVEIRRGAASNPLQQELVRIDGIAALTPLGDIDGDGLADVGVVRPARLYFGGTTCSSRYFVAGSLDVHYGGAAGPLLTSSWPLPSYDAPGCQNGWNYTTTFQIAGSLAGGGDLDGDTYGDVALVTPTLSDPGLASCANFPGQVRLFYGSASGIVAPPAQIIDGPDGAGHAFGWAAALIGNVSGDGADELLVSAATKQVRVLSGPQAAMSVVQTLGVSGNTNQYGIKLIGGL
ncbi:RTX toxin [Minicystis rosea]|nr:RTX toxin [Minicystis rosea]